MINENNKQWTPSKIIVHNHSHNIITIELLIQFLIHNQNTKHSPKYISIVS